MWASASAALGMTGLVRHFDHIRARPLMLFTEPPLPGVLLLIALGTLILVWILAPSRRLGLRNLRMVEWAGVFVTAGFFAFNQTLSLKMGTAFDIKDNSMDLGAGLAAPWGAIIVAYGVLIPSSARQSIARTAFLAFCAFIPEAIAFPGTIGLGGGAPVYLSIKAVMVAAMSALAIYGSYRIEVLRHDAQAARQLGQYQLRRLLGEGGMGEVHLAVHQFLRRPCAVKLIHPEQAGNEDTLARFEREVQAAARLTHPNTIQIYDYGRAEDGTFYYAMEYLPGISLQQLVERHGPITPARTVRVLTQICGALREAHASGLVHRDIKPGNVMLCARGGMHDVAKLLDYGIVASTVTNEEDLRLTRSGVIVGTPEFMSPEQCGGDAEVTGASDMYSLGLVAYFLLAGRSPFTDRSAVQMMAAHLYEMPKPLTEFRDDISAGLSDVITRCLAKLPEDRFPDMDALQLALTQSVRDEEWTEAHAREWWRTTLPEIAAPSAVS
jgi:serine/threonine-protein kinase